MVASRQLGRILRKFFITLARADWLDGKHTIFGHVEGDTIFNVLNMAIQGEIDGFDNPEAPKLLSIEIQESPINDFVQSTAVKCGLKLEDEGISRADGQVGESSGKRAVRDTNVLSFGSSADDENTDDDNDEKEKRGQQPARRSKEAVSVSPDTPGARKRARFGFKSSHDLLVDDPVLQRSTNEINPVADSKSREPLARSDHTGSLDTANLKSTTPKPSASEILAQAEREYQQLRAEAAKTIAPSTETTSTEPSHASVLPAKYAKLQRGVKSKKPVGGRQRKELEAAAARLKELKLRVQAGADAGLAKHLVFRQSAGADTGVEHEYAIIDPLDGNRGRASRRSGRPERKVRREGS